MSYGYYDQCVVIDAVDYGMWALVRLHIFHASHSMHNSKE